MYFYAIGLCVSILRDAWFSLISFVNRFESLKALYTKIATEGDIFTQKCQGRGEEGGALHENVKGGWG